LATYFLAPVGTSHLRRVANATMSRSKQLPRTVQVRLQLAQNSLPRVLAVRMSTPAKMPSLTRCRLRAHLIVKFARGEVSMAFTRGNYLNAPRCSAPITTLTRSAVHALCSSRVNRLDTMAGRHDRQQGGSVGSRRVLARYGRIDILVNKIGGNLPATARFAVRRSVEGPDGSRRRHGCACRSRRIPGALI
jgi:hypothetical protein